MEKLLKIGRHKEGKLKNIAEVANGLACECFCPNCDHPLVAKNNRTNKKEAHFAHASGKECQGAVETAIHLLAKQVFLETKTISLPSYHFDYDPENKRSKFGKANQVITFDSVLVEKSVNVNGQIIRPDAIGIKGGRKIFIEFAKTHFIESEKENLIKLSGYACLELDLNELDQTEQALSEFLLDPSDEARKRWVANAKMDCDYQNHLKAIATRKEEKRIARLEKIRLYRLNNTLQVLQLSKIKLETYQCPLLRNKLKEFKGSVYYRIPLVRRIIDGEYWNGKFYGTQGNGSWIHLSNEKAIVYPAYGQTLPENSPNPNFVFKGLYTIKEEVIDKELNRCIACEFAVDRFEEELLQVCRYPKV